jgi:hypothetical protein
MAKPRGSRETFFRLFRLPRREIRSAELVVRFSHRGPYLGRLSQVADGFAGLSEFQERLTRAHLRLGKIRILAERGGVKLKRFLDLVPLFVNLSKQVFGSILGRSQANGIPRAGFRQNELALKKLRQSQIEISLPVVGAPPNQLLKYVFGFKILTELMHREAQQHSRVTVIGILFQVFFQSGGRSREISLLIQPVCVGLVRIGLGRICGPPSPQCGNHRSDG